jgi:hypothetical protein
MLHFGLSRPATIRALADSTSMSYDELMRTAGNAGVRELMAKAHLSQEWTSACSGQYEDGASPWLLELALEAYRDEYVSSQVVADVLGRTDDVDAVEDELALQGWAG